MIHKRPPLPITTDLRDLVEFCLNFQSVAGFVAEYEAQYERIKHTSRTKKGLKSAAYEATEQLYVQYLNRGRKYPDSENFFDAYSKYKKRSKGDT